MIPFRASRGCRRGLPEIARSRTSMELIQQSTRLEVRISSPTLRQIPTPQHVGTVLGSRLRFVLVGDSDTGEGWTYPDLIDYFSETEKFGFTGIAQGTLNSSEIRDHGRRSCVLGRADVERYVVLPDNGSHRHFSALARAPAPFPAKL